LDALESEITLSMTGVASLVIRDVRLTVARGAGDGTGLVPEETKHQKIRYKHQE